MQSWAFYHNALSTYILKRRTAEKYLRVYFPVFSVLNVSDEHWYSIHWTHSSNGGHNSQSRCSALSAALQWQVSNSWRGWSTDDLKLCSILWLKEVALGCVKRLARLDKMFQNIGRNGSKWFMPQEYSSKFPCSTGAKGKLVLHQRLALCMSWSVIYPKALWPQGMPSYLQEKGISTRSNKNLQLFHVLTSNWIQMDHAKASKLLCRFLDFQKGKKNN